MYQISYTVEFVANNVGVRNTRINTSTTSLPLAYTFVTATQGSDTVLSGSTIIYLANNGTFNVTGFQNCGAALLVKAQFTSIQILVL
jgi:hypothetical protein